MKSWAAFVELVRAKYRAGASAAQKVFRSLVDGRKFLIAIDGRPLGVQKNPGES